MEDSRVVVMITGASGNLGRAAAEAFQEVGAHTVLVDRSADRLQQAFTDLVGAPEHLLAGGVDLTDERSVQAVVRRAVEQFGRLDVLFNTVGAYKGGVPVLEDDLSNWDFMAAVNLRTTLIAIRAVLPQMIEQGRGCLINTASRDGLVGAAGSAAYGVSKAGVVRLTESLSQETKHVGLTVNCIVPGTIDTPQNRESMPDADFDQWVTPESIAEVVLFLASDAARAITGVAIPIYGRS